MRLRGCAGWSGPLMLQITGHVFLVVVQLLYVSFNHDTYNKTRCERISTDKASNFPKRDVRFILLK